MATISKVYTPANIWQGPVDVYVNVPAPASHNPPTADPDEITLDANGQPPSGGVHLGSLEAPAQISITEKFNEIRDDQHESAGDVAFDTVEAEVDVVLKETALDNLKTLLSSSALGTYTALAASKVLQVGGQATSALTFFTLMLVGANRANTAKFAYVFAFKAYLKSAVQFTFHRAKENSHKLKLGCVADLTRIAGDELMQIVKTK
jgi:hypothetical protein